MCSPRPFVRLFLGAMVLLASVSLCSATSRRSADSSSIRQIGQASLIFAQDHHDRLPQATDVWDYAAQLAYGVGFNDPGMWQSKSDPAVRSGDGNASTILLSHSARDQTLNPTFRNQKLSLAVPLGRLTTNMPPTTPIIWTRGLQPDGTWATHSPYQGRGGYIAFLGGNVVFYKNLGRVGAGEIARFDGQGTTNNILEALPPGTRVGEYIPTAAEQRSWERRAKFAEHKPLIGGVVILLIGLSIGIYACIKKALRPTTLIAALITTTIFSGVIYLQFKNLPQAPLGRPNP